MGHVIRCLALAEMLKNDFTISFAIQKPLDSVIKIIHTITETILHLPATDDYSLDSIHFSEFLEPNDIVILDGYNFKTDYQKIIKDKGCKLIAIDDLHSWHQFADVIINHAAGIKETDYSKEKYTKLYLGLDYVLLRKPFIFASTKIKHTDSIKKVFISMGAADINNLTQKFTEALIQTGTIEEIHLMLGGINPNIQSIDKLIEQNRQINIVKHFDISAEQLASLLKKTDLAICPASTISLEACSIGIGLISGYTAENQKGNIEGLEKRKTLINLGDFNTLPKDKIISMLKIYFEKPSLFDTIILNQKVIIDGKSPERIRNIFKNLRNG